MAAGGCLTYPGEAERSGSSSDDRGEKERVTTRSVKMSKGLFSVGQLW